MMWHPLLMGLALILLLVSGPLALFGLAWPYFSFGATLLGLLFLERLAAGGRAFARFGDAASLTFPLLHLARDVMWVAAIGAWTKRWITGQPSLPSHSMRARAHSG